MLVTFCLYHSAAVSFPDPKQLPIHRKCRTAPPVPRLSIGTVLYSSVRLRGLPCHVGLLAMISIQLRSYNWFANLHAGLEISVTICRGSWCFCSMWWLVGGDPIAAVQAHRQKQVFCALGLNDQLCRGLSTAMVGGLKSS